MPAKVLPEMEEVRVVDNNQPEPQIIRVYNVDGGSIISDDGGQQPLEEGGGPIKRSRIPYPPRVNMGECFPRFGKVTVFVAVATGSYKT